MPVNPLYNARTGGKKVIVLAQTLCRLVNTAAPIIRLRYSDRTALLAVLTAAEELCALLPAAVQEQTEADAIGGGAFNPGDLLKVPGEWS